MPNITCTHYHATIPASTCAARREKYRATGSMELESCGRCEVPLPEGVGGYQPRTEHPTEAMHLSRMNRRQKRNLGGVHTELNGSHAEKKSVPPIKDAQGEQTPALTSRPGTAGDKQADKQPRVSSARLDQDRPGGVPHHERAAVRPNGQEGRATGQDAPRPKPPKRMRFVGRLDGYGHLMTRPGWIPPPEEPRAKKKGGWPKGVARNPGLAFVVLRREARSAL